MNDSPTIAVILPTFNGSKFLEKQINSILNQKYVSVTIYIFDDDSNDNTIEIINKINNPKIVFIDFLKKYSKIKSASNSFYRMILGINLDSKFKYVAFSDQDDIWFSNKLIRAVNTIESSCLGGYSSSVIAYWDNGITKYIKKSGNASSANSLFESAGPGCTYVLKREPYDLFRQFLMSNINHFQNLDFHDWAVYSFLTHNNFKWYIDSFPTMFYRQHSSNTFGASYLLSQKIKRLNMLKNGWYFKQVYIIHLLFLRDKSMLAKKKLKIIQRVYLFFSIIFLRRRIIDKIIISIFSLFFNLRIDV